MQSLFLPVLPIANQVLLPDAEMRVPICGNAQKGKLFKAHRMCVVVQVMNDKGEHYDIGCSAVVSDVVEAGDDQLVVYVHGIARVRVLKYSKISYAHPFATVEGLDAPHENIGPLYGSDLYGQLMLAAATKQSISTDAVACGNGEISAVLACMLPMAGNEKQYLLESTLQQRDALLDLWIQSRRNTQGLH